MNSKFLLAVAVVFGFCAANGLAATTQNTVQSQVKSFTAKLCSADKSVEHVFVVPVAVFKNSGEVDCDFDKYTLRYINDKTDPGHVLYNIDPPKGVSKAFDCDAKADEGMKNIGVNCLPVDKESSDHHQH